MKFTYRKIRNQILWLLISFIAAVLPVPHHALALTENELNTISVYERVAPSVVNITTEICQPEFFFCSIPQSGSGSGIVLREDGTIVTNYHVIADARGVQVTLGDGRRLLAEMVGSSPDEDLAIIRVAVGKHPLKAIQMGDSKRLKIGEKVLVIGNPFGLGQTLTVGTISMLHRNIRSGSRILEDLIQTDASINPGNSGGALVNSDGELIGMSTMILSPTGSSIGLGFGIPSNHIKEAVPGLTQTWGKGLGWLAAALIVLWMARRIYRLR